MPHRRKDQNDNQQRQENHREVRCYRGTQRSKEESDSSKLTKSVAVGPCRQVLIPHESLMKRLLDKTSPRLRR